MPEPAATLPAKDLAAALAGAATVETVPAAKASHMQAGVDNTPVVIPALLIVVRVAIGVKEETRKSIEREIAKARKIDGMPEIVVAPPGIYFEPVFEPAEMGKWRDEIVSLRRQVEEQRQRADVAEGKLRGVTAAAIRHAQEADGIEAKA